MSIAVVGLLTRNLPLLMFVLFLTGTQSALFGPVKYSILPQHLREEELVGGNAQVEAATFLAILLGTMAGGWLMSLDGGVRWISGSVMVIAVLGFLKTNLRSRRPTG